MRKLSFFWQIVILAMGVSLVFALFTMGMAYRDIRSAWVDSTANHLRSLCIEMEEQVLPLLIGGREAEADRLAKRLGRDLSARITLIKPDGRVVADTEADPSKMGNHADREEVQAAMRLGTGEAVRHSLTLHEDRVYVALRTPHTGPLQALIRASCPLQEVDKLTARLVWEIVLASGIGLTLIFLLTLGFSRRLVRPVRQLTQAAGRLADGDFQTRVTVTDQGEMKGLAQAFNTMAEHVQRSFDEISRRKEQLEMVVTAIQEGLAVIGPDQRILRANPSFWKQLGLDGREGLGQPFWQTIRAPEFSEAFRRCLESAATVNVEMTIDSRAFLCSLSPLRLENSIAVLIIDVTERKRVENLQKEMVVNFSHEFKTPLTAVRGYAEALEDEARDDRAREYAAIIRRNAERLQRITEDLLLLARLDRKEMIFKPEPVPLAEALETVAALYRPALREKRLSLTVDLPPDLPPILADPFLLEQVFVNLFDNAVRHTSRGGLAVTGARQGRMATVHFADTGEGIAAEHLGRIFDRFYVVDASRSRRKDGTGLGLAIVRTIVLRHGGEIAVESRLGEGTTFRLSFPLAP